MQMFPNRQKVPPKKEGCEIKIKRDKLGRVIGIETNGKCSRTELEMFKENNSRNTSMED